LWNKSVAQLSTFESAFTRLLEGYPAGAALEYFNARYAELATTLSADLEDLKMNKKVDPLELATTWTANNDARGYIIIGDPAVRLAVGAADAPAAPHAASFALSFEENGKELETNKLDKTLEKLELQVAALAETIHELRAALKK
jgi:hypothetical protein